MQSCPNWYEDIKKTSTSKIKLTDNISAILSTNTYAKIRSAQTRTSVKQQDGGSYELKNTEVKTKIPGYINTQARRNIQKPKIEPSKS